MAQIRQLKSKEFGTVEFLFGTRILKLIKTHMGVDDILKLATKFTNIGKDIEQGGQADVSELMDFVSKLLWIAHENACFYKRTDLIIDDPDRMFFLIDELGMDKVFSVAMDGYLESVNIEGDGKKKQARAKQPL
jgi:hypothetical protein